jgi:hypothetical protein
MRSHVACILALPQGLRQAFGPTSVQFKGLVAPRGSLHRAGPRKRHQMRHLCEFAGFLAKQVLSQLSYTPTRCNQYSFNSLQRVLELFQLRCSIHSIQQRLGIGWENLSWYRSQNSSVADEKVERSFSPGRDFERATLDGSLVCNVAHAQSDRSSRWLFEVGDILRR